jgi:hypothetical protein
MVQPGSPAEIHAPRRISPKIPILFPSNQYRSSVQMEIILPAQLWAMSEFAKIAATIRMISRAEIGVIVAMLVQEKQVGNLVKMLPQLPTNNSHLKVKGMGPGK